MPQLDPSVFSSQLIWLAISFIGLYVIMAKFILPKIGGVITRRAAQIEDDVSKAATLRDEAARALSDYETALADARARAAMIGRGARAAAAERLTAREAELTEKLDKQLAEAERKIINLRAEMAKDIPSMAAPLIADIIKAACGEEVDMAAIDETLTRLRDTSAVTAATDKTS